MGKPAEINKGEIVYRGYSYDQEVTIDQRGQALYHHKVRHPDGYWETIPWAMAETISPDEFRFLVDHDFPTMADFQLNNFPSPPRSRRNRQANPLNSIQDGVYNSHILSCIRRFMAERGCETVEMTAIMVKLSGWKYWEEIV